MGQEEERSVDKANLGLGKGASKYITLPSEAPGHLSGFPMPFSMFLQQETHSLTVRFRNVAMWGWGPAPALAQSLVSVVGGVI